ncbi:MAG: ATP-binding protein [Pseudomonadales bacterium]|nr:ATP-binding protein [Pseudomonadales bacterium]
MKTRISVVTGPESSGKTTLAGQLADHFGIPLVNEVSRDYLEQKCIPGMASYHYEKADLLEIASLQQHREQSLLQLAPPRLVCDTDLLVIMIWSEVRYGNCDPWIYRTFEANLNNPNYPRHYFLCHWDIPWEADPLRENPHDRDELFARYQRKLEHYALDYTLVQGNPATRLQLALNTRF